MPKGTKAAPPQQASLNELWKRKGKSVASKDATEPPESVSKLEYTEARYKPTVETNGEGMSKLDERSSSKLMLRQGNEVSLRSLRKRVPQVGIITLFFF